MNGGSSLPPLKRNDGKLALIALLLLLAALGVWFFLRGSSAEPEAAPAEPPPTQAPTREQFAAEIEIPEEEQLPEAEPSEPASSSRQGPSSTQVPPSEWVCTGRIDTAQVRSFVRGPASKQVQTCYERGLKNNNLLQGSMEVELTIGPNGSVRAVAVRGTLRDAQVYSCVRRVARTWKFSAPEGGCVRINAPFQMTPKL